MSRLIALIFAISNGGVVYTKRFYSAIVNTGASVDHDSVIGDYAHVAPGARLGGHVRVGEGALLGVGSAFLPGVSVGAWATVGVGAAVVGDVPEGVIARGVPARWR